MNRILEDRVAIVTGAANGLGLAMARGLSDAGAHVLVADIDGEAAEQAAASLPSATGVSCDVTDEAQVEALVATAVREHGKLDVMVNNAGVAGVSPVVAMPLDEWRRVMAVNLDGVFLGVKHAGAAMAAGGGGSIVNISSIKGFGGMPAIGHYAAAKAAVISLTKTAALELRGHKVRVNAVCPGFFATALVSGQAEELKAVAEIDAAEYINHVQGRLAEPNEVAGLVVFLASDRAPMTNGTAYLIDGGATASLM